MSKTIFFILVISAAFFFILLLSVMQSTTRGRDIFLREGCPNCHSFKGEGGTIGPDLNGVRQRRSMIWILNQIRNPESHNPGSRMPHFTHLSVVERYALWHYLKD